MAVAEILTTNKECFMVLENGFIIMEKGKYEPDVAPITDVYVKPKKPEPGPIDFVEHNIWGQEIYRENADIRAWRLKCAHIDAKNEKEHQKQRKAFKQHIADIRRSYYRQEKLREKEEKAKMESLISRQRVSARAYLEQISRNEEEHQKQRKTLKKYIADIRSYYRQRKLHQKEEKAKSDSLISRQRISARAYLERLSQRELS